MSTNQKFKQGDVVRLLSGGENMVVKEYKVNYVGGILNAITKENKYEDSVTTSEVLCEWMYKGAVKRGSFEESSLEIG